jgi:hypothetical protein
MAGRFPPVSNRHEEFERLFGAFLTISPGRRLTYLSAPLTTGPRFFVWRRQWDGTVDEQSAAYQREFRRHVFEPNRVDAGKVSEGLRNKLGEPVIDPTGLPDQPGWTQDDYRVFWARFIERFARRVVFMDGWASSDGCGYEFLSALESDCELLDQRLTPLDRDLGIRALEAALEERSILGQSLAFGRDLLEAVRSVEPTPLAR